MVNAAAMRRLTVLFGAMMVTTLCAQPLAGGQPPADWPQFHGPRRDNISTETGLLKTWPEGGPKLLWTVSGLGHGFSTVAVADGLIYTTGNVGDDTVITALALDGKVLWRVANGPAYERDKPGTRATPTIDGGRLYHENADGNIVCLDAKTGKQVWHVNILEQFNGRNIQWALAESLLIDGDNIICTPGGKEIGLAALDKDTGKTVWTCTGIGDKPGYCSPILFEHEGLRQIATLMATSVVGVSAADGRLLWKVDHVTPFDENITSPIYHDGHVFWTTRTTGARLYKLNVSGEACTVEKVWATDDLDNQHGGVILIEGHLYGSAMSAKPGPWMCLEFATGKRTCADAGIGRASFTWADGMLYALNHNRGVALVKASPGGFNIISRFSIPKGGRGPSWAHPVVCGGRLYIRHSDLLFCYDVKAQ
ncbi:MAG TPA: PQQ-binding-like beta-propeller repeat protein [Phycisphaerae bacterium]|nr:PQQ-binding-like beta-propeller repeat protein [Phycisphaerae bacterium]